MPVDPVRQKALQDAASYAHSRKKQWQSMWKARAKEYPELAAEYRGKYEAAKEIAEGLDEMVVGWRP